MTRPINCYLLITLVYLLTFASALSQDKKGNKTALKAEQFIDVMSIVQGKNFQFEATKCFPKGNGAVDISSSQNFTTIKDSIASARMPFFGEAYVSVYVQDGPIVYDGKMNDVEVVVNDKKSSIKLSYNIKGETDTYEVSIVVYYNRDAKMIINSNHRSTISYLGSVSVLNEK